MSVRDAARVRRVLRATHAVAVYVAHATTGHAALGDAFILAQLGGREGPASVGELHAAFGHRRSTLTGILDRLEGRRLVRRSVSARDRRSFLVALTAAGRRAALSAAAAFEELEAALAASVAPSDLRGFDRTLDALVSAAAQARAAPRAKRAG